MSQIMDKQTQMSSWNAFQTFKKKMKQLANETYDPEETRQEWDKMSTEQKTEFISWTAFQDSKKDMKRLANEIYDPEETHPSMEQREHYSQEKQGNVTEKGKKVSIVCNVNQFLKEIKNTDRQGERNTWVDSPFSSLSEMQKGILVKSDAAEKLIKMLDPKKLTIDINGVEHTIKPDDFVEIMGTKEGDEPLDFGTVQYWDELFQKFGAYENDNKKEKPYVSRQKVVKVLKEGSDVDAKRAYNLLALMRVLLPNRRERFPAKYLNTIDTCCNKNRAAHILHEMATDIEAYKSSKATSPVKVGGCILFLQLFYMKKVSALPPQPNGNILQSVTEKMVQSFVNQHLQASVKTEILNSVHDRLQKRLRELTEEAVGTFGDEEVEAFMGSYQSSMNKAIEAQHSCFFQNPQNEGPESENEDTSLSKDTNVDPSLSETQGGETSSMGGGRGSSGETSNMGRGRGGRGRGGRRRGRGGRGTKRGIPDSQRDNQIDKRITRSESMKLFGNA